MSTRFSDPLLRLQSDLPRFFVDFVFVLDQVKQQSGTVDPHLVERQFHRGQLRLHEV